MLNKRAVQHVVRIILFALAVKLGGDQMRSVPELETGITAAAALAAYLIDLWLHKLQFGGVADSERKNNDGGNDK